jgi:dTDP-4-dehydrorhamnose 3,5-epimerase
VAHGFVTLADDTEVFYQMSQRYDAACARGVRWDDPAFGIVWPVPIVLMSERDRRYADFSPHALGSTI